jgi:hypothetical protein
MNDKQSHMRSYFISQICKQRYGIQKARTLKYAPSWTSLQKYGGTMTDDEFRTHLLFKENHNDHHSIDSEQHQTHQLKEG